MVCSLVQRYDPFSFFRKGPGNNFPLTLSGWFSKQNVFSVIFHELTKFNCPIAFTSWDIGQEVYRNYGVKNFEINIFLIKSFLYMTKKVKTKNLNFLGAKRAFKVK